MNEARDISRKRSTRPNGRMEADPEDVADGGVTETFAREALKYIQIPIILQVWEAFAAWLDRWAIVARSLGNCDGKRTRRWLRGRDFYTLHKTPKSKFNRHPIIVSGPAVQ